MAKGGNTVKTVWDIVEPFAEELGLKIWDVRFLKEGASWYLRVFIDKPQGITIDDCTNVTHAINPIIDEADPIDKSYYLEVCSCGIERELLKPEHFEKVLGQKIKIKLYKAVDGVKEFVGVLKTFEPEIVIETDGIERGFVLKDISKANLCDFE